MCVYVCMCSLCFLQVWHVLLDEIEEFWTNSVLHQELIIDKMMSLTLVTNMQIVNWLFDAKHHDKYLRSYIWTILHNTVDKTMSRTKAVEQVLDAARGELTQVWQAL